MANRSELSPEDPETVWLRDVYQPDAVNLTVRAVIVGMIIGVLMCLSNLYVFFKTGWSVGVTITAGIIAWAVFRVGTAARIAKPLGALENNALTTVASGSGYMTGGGNMAAYGALMMILSATPGALGVPSTFLLILWFGAIAALGVFVAIPIKRQMVNREALPFPTGTATATTIKTLHAAGGDGVAKAKALGLAALLAASLTWLRGGWKILDGTLVALPIKRAGHTLQEWTISISSELVLVGTGMMMGFRTGWSVLLGSVLTYGIFAPALFADGVIAKVEYGEIVKWSMWPGAGILVGSGLTSFALDYKSLVRAFSGVSALVRGRRDKQEGIAAVESPEWWFPAAFAVLAPIIVVLMVLLFKIPWWAGVVAVFLAVLMGFVAARVTGETDTTPTKALGPVTQMIFGGMTPGQLAPNVMGANVTGGIGLHAADLLTTLKTGWLLGGKPRHQLYAQLFGVLVGASILVPAFNLMFPDPSVLGTTEWPAPASRVWKNVSEIVVEGVGQLSPQAQLAMVLGLALGVGLAILEKVAPKHLKAFIPSPSGLGIAMVIPGYNGIALFLGASFAAVMRRAYPGVAEKYVVPAGAGLIAGESLMGVTITLITQIAGVTVAIQPLDVSVLLKPFQ